MKCCSNKISVLEEKPCWLRSIPTLPVETFDEAMLLHQLKQEWLHHVKHHYRMYDELMIQSGSYQRHPFVIYDRKKVEIVSGMSKMAIAMKAPLVKRVLSSPAMEAYPLNMEHYPKDDQHHLNTLAECSLKLYELLFAMDQYFPFACRYYGEINPYSKWGSETPFINPMEHEIQDIRQWIEKIKNIIETANLKQYEKSNRLEYAMWFVYNHIRKINEDRFYEPNAVIYNAILLYTYIEETIYEHIQKILDKK